MKDLNRNYGFTLLELLVVIAVLAIGITGIGLATVGNNPSSRLDSAIRILRTELKSAQMRARITGVPTAVAIEYDRDYPDRFLRYLLPVRNENGNWVASGNGKSLPKGIYVVPGSPSEVQPGWNMSKLSVFLNEDGEILYNPDGRGDRRFIVIRMSPNGTPDQLSLSNYLESDAPVSVSAPVIYFSVARATEDADRPLLFESTSIIGGVRVSRNGNVIVIGN